MYDYQKTNRYFAQAADDIKDIVEEELISFGAQKTSQAYCGIHFTANAKVVYTINFQSRLINRVLAPLVSFNCSSDDQLYKGALQVSWEDFLDPSKTFAVFASVTNSYIQHSKFASLRLKDAIVDYLRDRTGSRPSIDTREPDIWLNLHIENNEATISLDTSGGSLHRRGYRKQGIRAPMVETLAASIINFSGWDGKSALYDPFCGSGTLLCEAYMLASKTPASIFRKNFGFEKIPDFNLSLWKKVKEDALEKIKPVKKGIIAGSDISADAVGASIANCKVIDEENIIKIENYDVFDIDKIDGSTIICNPPYGIRIGNPDELGDFYKKLGDFLKQRCKNSIAFIYFGDRKFIKKIGLKSAWKKPLSNGGLDGRLVKYELY